jgi:SAM-dependent methyltransferase
MSVLPNDYDSDPGRFLATGEYEHDDVHPYVADGSVDVVAALYTLYHYADPRLPIKEARRVLRPGGLFAACAPNRDSKPELANVLPDWGARSSFDGEDAVAIVTSVFGAAGALSLPLTLTMRGCCVYATKAVG